MSVVATDVAEAVVAAATAAAGRLPSASPLTAGRPVTLEPPSISDSLPADAASAVQSAFSGSARGQQAIVVGEDLVSALKNSPLGELELASALQPALAAAAAAFGQVVVDSGVEVEVDSAVASMAATGAPVVVIVPLLADGVVAAAYVVAVTLAAVPKPRAGGDSLGASLGRRPGLDMLHDVEMEVSAELGRTHMTVRDLLNLAPGAVVELDRAAGSPSDLLVNGTLIARGEVVVVDEDFGIRITEIINPARADGSEGGGS